MIISVPFRLFERPKLPLIYPHPWLSMYIQGLLRNENESLFPNDVIVAKQIVLVTIQIHKNNVSLVLIDNQFARNGG